MELLIAAGLALAGTGGYRYFLRPARMRFPKCLVCSKRLLMVPDKVIVCPRCLIRYNRTTITEASPQAWESIRKQRTFALSYRRDMAIQHLLLEVPLSTLKGAVEETV